MADLTYDVMRQYEAVRRSGKTNMMDDGMVQRIAFESDFHALVLFIEDCTNAEYMEMAREAAKKYKGQEFNVPEVDDEITVEIEL